MRDFTTTENMTADKVADFLDRMSLRISRRIFVVLDNANVHRCRLMRELLPYEKSGGCSFSFSLLIAHILILPRLFGASSRGNGSDLWIISQQMPCSMPQTEPWRQSGLESKSILTI
nr:transposase [Prevotella veroralis]